MYPVYHTGVFFGYPKCCITWFMENRLGFKKDGNPELTGHQEEVHKSNGFIPCPQCAKAVATEGIPIEHLITNRLCSTPYPEDHSKLGIHLELETYLSNVEALNYSPIVALEEDIANTLSRVRSRVNTIVGDTPEHNIVMKRNILVEQLMFIFSKEFIRLTDEV